MTSNTLVYHLLLTIHCGIIGVFYSLCVFISLSCGVSLMSIPSLICRSVGSLGNVMSMRNCTLVPWCLFMQWSLPLVYVPHEGSPWHRDTTLRQISEGIDIEDTPQDSLMNTCSELNTPTIPQCIVRRWWTRVFDWRHWRPMPCTNCK